MKPNTCVKIGGLGLKNPITVASGTFAYGEEFHKDYYDISGLGAVFTKGISLKPRRGNPPQRTVETASGMLNAIGLQNVGLDVFIKEKLPFLKTVGATVIVNIFGETIDEYAEVAKKIDAADGVHGIELNISCPNVAKGGVVFGTDPNLAADVTRAVRATTRKTLIVKLSPNYHNIPLMTSAIADAGADAVSLINTITGMAIDAEKRRPILANITGGLSGPAIKPVALRMVWEASRIGIPVIGVGGITNITDVIEFLLAGASAVQIGTANFVHPMTAHNLVGELEKYLVSHKIKDVHELVRGLIT